MSVSTFLFIGIAFGAGVICGVVLGEKGIVTTNSLEQGGKFIVDTTVAAGRKMRVAVSPSAGTATP